jgi:hypothetical protein
VSLRTEPLEQIYDSFVFLERAWFRGSEIAPIK